MGIRRSGRREAVRLLHVALSTCTARALLHPSRPAPILLTSFPAPIPNCSFADPSTPHPLTTLSLYQRHCPEPKVTLELFTMAHLTHHATIQIASPMSRKPKNKGSSTGRSYETLMGLNIDNRGSHQSTSNGLSSGYRSQIKTETGQLMSCRAEINCPMPWTNSDG